MERSYVIGLDYGTDSVRALITDTADGEEISSATVKYSRWQEGAFCDPAENRFRQHPMDHLEGLKASISQALAQAPANAGATVKAISIDTTGSSPLPVDENGTALALRDDFQDNPNAMVFLWKDHSGISEAAEINQLARTWDGVDFTCYSGGIYSSEWFWAKILHAVRVDQKVREHAVSWVEHSDWLPAVLTGNVTPKTMKRNRCAAGHKAMWHDSWGGLPAPEFLKQLDPDLVKVRNNYAETTLTSDQSAGRLTEEWAEALGLPAGIPVGVGALDAHMGAVGAEIVPHALVKVMGTSTCDMLLAPAQDVGDKVIRGICGQVDGSIVPDMIGMEAGQSAFGDLYGWYRDLLSWPLSLLSAQLEGKKGAVLAGQIEDQILPALNRAAAACPIDPSGIVALDWHNGRRTPDANQSLKGAISGLTLASDAPALFRSLVEATAFGAKKIVDRFQEEGVHIDQVIAIGGVAKKSSFVMQTMADVLNMEIKVARSEQSVALGAAMYAAVVAGIYPTVAQAQKAMGSGVELSYLPNPETVQTYARLLEQYSRLGTFIEQQTTVITK